MKVKLAPIKANILVAMMMFAMSNLVQAEFLFSTNNGAMFGTSLVLVHNFN